MTARAERLIDVLRREQDKIVDLWLATTGYANGQRDHGAVLLAAAITAAERNGDELQIDGPENKGLWELMSALAIEEFFRLVAQLKEAVFSHLSANHASELDGEQICQINRGFDRVFLAMVNGYTSRAIRFIGILNHDLRSPLQAIMAAAGLLQRLGGTEQQQRLIGSILSSGQRAGRLIEDMLDFAQIRLGGLPIRPAEMDLHALGREVVGEVQLGHPQRKIELQCEGDGKGRWDADRIAQVMANLLRNAAHYSPPDTPIRMTIRDLGDAVQLSVHNEPPPIDPRLLPYLFMPMLGGMKQGRADKGLGLGLYIVKRIVMASGGTVDVHSTETDGTTFTVTLPRQSLAS